MIYNLTDTNFCKYTENSSIATFFLILFSFCIFLNYLYIQHISSVFKSNNFSDIKNLFRLVDSNNNTERARSVLNLNEITSFYHKKLAAVKTGGNLTSITGYNTTFVSRAFFNVIEFTIAEKCILCAYAITENEMNVEIKEKIVDLIQSYTNLWKNNEHLAAFSLLNRIMQNLSYIDNVNTFEILNLIKQIYDKRFKFKSQHFIYYFKPEYDIFNNNINFWRPDLELKLKNLRKISWII